MFSIIEPHIKQNRAKFKQDPFGYSASAWLKWAVIQNVSGLSIDPERPPNSEDLKSPVLWLSHARAMSEAGVVVLKSEPALDQMPDLLKGVCDSQYCAVGLMLVGFSLEICLKAMLIIRLGITTFVQEERKHRHHRLEELAEFVPNLSLKDKAILRMLTHFVVWAGRYPDPGSGRENKAEEIFNVAEQFEISADDLFDLSVRVMGHTKQVVET
ncbi:MAG: hypothetical protein WA081_03810 [Desulfosalsimonadaceae bacterium]